VTNAAWLLAAPLLWGTYTWGSYLLPVRTVRRGRRTERAVALTFDDGPDPIHTPQILDVLTREGVKATFFLIGERAEAAPDIARRIAADGHDLGNHTWSHRSLWLCRPGETRRQIERGHEAITAAAGGAPRFFRPPWGMTNLAMFGALRRLGTPCVFWTIQPEGRRAVSPDAQIRHTTARVSPGAILDLHDADGVPGAGARLARALPALIDALRSRGFTLAPLRDLL
jgi:peptidoglycan/xylan/chitin deacetylase (PgdA/CDA1 family)